MAISFDWSLVPLSLEPLRIPAINAGVPPIVPLADSASKLKVDDLVQLKPFAQTTLEENRWLNQPARVTEFLDWSVSVEYPSGATRKYPPAYLELVSEKWVPKVGDMVRLKKSSKWWSVELSVKTLTITNTEACTVFGPIQVRIVGAPSGDDAFHFKVSDLELVEAAPLPQISGLCAADAMLGIVATIDFHTEDGSIPTIDLSGPGGAFYKSDQPNLPEKTRIRVERSDKFEPLHGCEGVVLSVASDRKHKVQLDGDAFARETYSFRREELVEVKAENAPKEPDGPKVPSFRMLNPADVYEEDGDCDCDQLAVAVRIFRSDERVASFAKRVAEWKGAADWRRVERALRIAWDRDQNGWRTEAENRAERMFR